MLDVTGLGCIGLSIVLIMHTRCAKVIDMD